MHSFIITVIVTILFLIFRRTTVLFGAIDISLLSIMNILVNVNVDLSSLRGR